MAGEGGGDGGWGMGEVDLYQRYTVTARTNLKLMGSGVSHLINV